MIRVLFLIRRLDTGGAERQLVELVKALDKTRFHITVVTFYEGGAFEPEILRCPEISLVPLRKHGRWDVLPFLWRFCKIVRHVQPDIVHGYMATANEICLLVGCLFGAKVVWGIRSSFLDYSKYKNPVGWMFLLGRILSPMADLLIANSSSGKAFHIEQGYAPDRWAVIPNGIDTERFKPDVEKRTNVRRALGIKDHQRLVGLVGRVEHIKGQDTFLHAAQKVIQGEPNVRFLCVGGGNLEYIAAIKHLANQLGLDSYIIWLPHHADMPALYNAFDIAVSSSRGEGFSNVIAEAMACGTPTVVTDVGDSAYIVGDTGMVVAAQDSDALAMGILKSQSSQRDVEGVRARQRIMEFFATSQLAQRTEALFRTLASVSPVPSEAIHARTGANFSR